MPDLRSREFLDDAVSKITRLLYTCFDRNTFPPFVDKARFLEWLTKHVEGAVYEASNEFDPAEELLIVAVPFDDFVRVPDNVPTNRYGDVIFYGDVSGHWDFES